MLVEHKLILTIDKCSFLNKKINYLGYYIDKDGIRPSDEHVKAIKGYPVPRNIKELYSFVGLAAYFRKFVKDFSLLVKPLYDLLRKDVTFRFENKEIITINAIKSCLISQPLLCIYSPKAETQLHCDASCLGFGGLLTQKQSDRKFHPIFYFSQRTNAFESKLHSFELEMLAIIYSLRSIFARNIL